MLAGTVVMENGESVTIDPTRQFEAALGVGQPHVLRAEEYRLLNEEYVLFDAGILIDELLTSNRLK